MRALLLTQGGRSAAAEAVLESLPDDAAGAAQEVGQRATSWVRLRRGRPQSAAELALADWEESQGTAEAQVLHPSGHLMVAALGLLESGDLSRAETVAADGAAAAMTQGVEFQAGWLRWVSGTVALTAGRLDVAARRFAEVTASARTAGFASVIRLGLAGGLEVAAQRGDLELVRTLSDELAATQAPPELYSAHVSAALGWGEVARGSVAAAVLRWVEASEVLTAAGERVASAQVLHAAVRVGDRAAAATLVDVLADIEGPLARAREQHGQGVALQDADALAAAGDSFESLGVDLVAAECLSLASALMADSGSSRQAARLAARADVLLARCGGAATPALRAVTPLSDLTARELEIVQRAAAGRTSRQIAEDLVLSVRTVDNHLQSAYTKLGVTGRDQLAALLAPRSTDRIGQGDPS
jgi:DNA-binding CsgD family transcriptional regulator